MIRPIGFACFVVATCGAVSGSISGSIEHQGAKTPRSSTAAITNYSELMFNGKLCSYELKGWWKRERLPFGWLKYSPRFACSVTVVGASGSRTTYRMSPGTHVLAAEDCFVLDFDGDSACTRSGDAGLVKLSDFQWSDIECIEWEGDCWGDIATTSFNSWKRTCDGSGQTACKATFNFTDGSSESFCFDCGKGCVEKNGNSVCLSGAEPC